MEKNDGIIHATGQESARVVGQRNILEMAEWLARWGYTTPEILCSLIGVKSSSQKRIVKRLLDGHWAKLVPCPTAVDGYCQRTHQVDKHGKIRTLVSEPMLLVPTGKSRTLFSTTYGVQAARALGTGSAERIFHELSVQRCAIFAAERFKRDWLLEFEIWPGSLFFQVYPPEPDEEDPQKIYDAIVLLRGQDQFEQIGLEIELSRKDDDYGLIDSFRRISTDLLNDHVDSVYYFFSSESLANQYREKCQSWTGYSTFHPVTEMPMHENNLRETVRFIHLPEIFRMRFH